MHFTILTRCGATAAAAEDRHYGVLKPQLSASGASLSPELHAELDKVEARLRNYPNPLAYLTAERVAEDRAAGQSDTFGTGPRHAVRR